MLSKLNIAEKNAPKERRAQALANSIIKTKQQEYDITDKKELTKIKQMALNDARISVGASGKDSRITITDKEWEANLMSNEDYNATIEAYTYPKQFEECDGSKEIAPGVVIGQQKRKTFGFSYVTKVGNDVDGVDHGYKLHLVYGCLASPSEKGHSSVNESPEAMTLSWSVSTAPVTVPGFKPTATVTINSTTVNADELAALEAILYGSEEEEPRLPLPEELITIFKSSAVAQG